MHLLVLLPSRRSCLRRPTSARSRSRSTTTWPSPWRATRLWRASPAWPRSWAWCCQVGDAPGGLEFWHLVGAFGPQLEPLTCQHDWVATTSEQYFARNTTHRRSSTNPAAAPHCITQLHPVAHIPGPARCLPPRAVSFFERAGNAYFNSVVVADTDGSIVGHYRKSHIPDGPG
jgi:hypothetical protein